MDGANPFVHATAIQLIPKPYYNRSAELTIPPSSDARQLVYHRDLQALFAARFRRAGLLATFLSLVGSVRWIAPAANGQLSQQSLSLFHPRLKIFLFASPSHRSLRFLLQDRLHGFPGLFTDTSEHIRFLLFSFSVSHFLVVGSVG